jgi:hypothetical protein
MTDRDDGPISDEEIGKLWARYWTPYSKGRIDVALPRFTRALLRREGERLLQLIDNLLDAETAIDSVDGKRAICRMLGVEEKP